MLEVESALTFTQFTWSRTMQVQNQAACRISMVTTHFYLLSYTLIEFPT